MTLRNAFENLALESTLSARFGGGKLPFVADITASGTTTLLTPATGKYIVLYWVSAIANPADVGSPLIKIGFQRSPNYYCYNSYAIGHWEPYAGAVNEPVIINLNQSGNVAVSLTYKEI